MITSLGLAGIAANKNCLHPVEFISKPKQLIPTDPQKWAVISAEVAGAIAGSVAAVPVVLVSLFPDTLNLNS